MYTPENSPFEKFRTEKLKGVAMSPDVRELVALAYESGFIDGMQKQMQSSVDRAVNRMAEQPAQQEFVCSTGLCYYKAQQQEPVAWLRNSDLVELRACNYMRLGADSPSIWAPNAPDEPSPDMELVAVYTSPPAQRTWVGLTDEDLAGCDESEYKAARYWETKLKEKNQ